MAARGRRGIMRVAGSSLSFLVEVAMADEKWQSGASDICYYIRVSLLDMNNQDQALPYAPRPGLHPGRKAPAAAIQDGVAGARTGPESPPRRRYCEQCRRHGAAKRHQICKSLHNNDLRATPNGATLQSGFLLYGVPNGAWRHRCPICPASFQHGSASGISRNR